MADPASIVAAWAACFSDGPSQPDIAAVNPQAVAQLCSAGHADLLVTCTYDALQSRLREEHVRRFWKVLAAVHSNRHNDPDAAALEAVVLSALQQLGNAVQQQVQYLSELSQSALRHAAQYPPSVLHKLAQLPNRHQQVRGSPA